MSDETRWWPGFRLPERCFLVLGILGGRASTRDIRLWLGNDGDPHPVESVRCALRGLAQRQPPLVTQIEQGETGRTASVWQLTEHGHWVLDGTDQLGG